MTVLRCASCNALLAPLAAWKGSGDNFFCNEFCAEADDLTDESAPSIVPAPDQSRWMPRTTKADYEGREGRTRARRRARSQSAAL